MLHGSLGQFDEDGEVNYPKFLFITIKSTGTGHNIEEEDAYAMIKKKFEEKE